MLELVENIPFLFYFITVSSLTGTTIVPLYVQNLDETDCIAQARKLAGYFQDDKLPLSDVLATIQQQHPNDRILLIADQFDELYTLCKDEQIRRKFLNILLHTFQSFAEQSSLSTVLVAAMRADVIKLERNLLQTKTVTPDVQIQGANLLRQIVDWQGEKEINILDGHQHFVYGVAFNPEGDLIASGGGDDTVKLWEPDGTLVRILEGHQDVVYGVAFSSDGNLIASTSRDKTVKLWNFNRDELLKHTCSWVNDYLKNNPKVSEDERQLCGIEASATAFFLQGEQLAAEGNIDQAVSAFQKAVKLDSNFSLSLAAASLLQIGEYLAAQQQIDEAILAFQRALDFNPSLNFAPQTKARRIAFVKQGESLAKDGKINGALTNYKKAQELDSDLEISATSWNKLCWYSSLHRQAEKVIFACKKAVQLAPGNKNFLDSRGIAKALTGDIDGAIKDFEAFIAWTHKKSNKTQRQGWVESLKNSENPFTPEELEYLRNNQSP